MGQELQAYAKDWFEGNSTNRETSVEGKRSKGGNENREKTKGYNRYSVDLCLFADFNY